MKNKAFTLILILATWLGSSFQASAAESDGAAGHEAVAEKTGRKTQSHSELAKKATDPLASLVQIQLQNYFKFDSIDGGYGNEITVQPVIPIKATGILPRAIFRPTLSIISTSDMDDGTKGRTGTGDLAEVYVWALDKKWGTLGLGLAGAAPLASDSSLGDRKWTVGPALYFLNTQIPKVQWGALIFNTFSVGGEGTNDVNSLSVQLVFNYHLGKGWYTGWGDQAMEFDWEDGGAVYFPLSARLGKVITIGTQDIDVNGQFIYNVGDRTQA